MKLSPRRAEFLSLLALGLQGLFFLLTLLVASRIDSLAVRIGAWLFLGGTGIWLVLFVQFRQRRLAQEERFDFEQYEHLRSEGKDTSVFEGTAVQGQMHIAAQRLEWIEKFLPAVFGVLSAAYLIVMGSWLLRMVRAAENIVPAIRGVRVESAVYLIGFALISFLFSRYAVGMSHQSIWRPLRAGGSYLLSSAIACGGLAIVILVPDIYYKTTETVAAHVLAILMIAIGAEIILNLILDAYRPRIKGQYRRAAYESRLLGLFSEPGGLVRTATHAIDYQFGFKVSETWFYKLLEKAVLPMLVIQVLILYLFSGFAIVPPGNVGVLERWGKPLNISEPYQSGLHLKFPWPIDKISLFPVEQLHIIEVGFVRNDPGFDETTGREISDITPILWTQEHWKQEYPFMVAVAESLRLEDTSSGDVVESSQNSKEIRSVFDMLVLALSIHYRIDDVSQYGYGKDKCYKDPHQLLESICYNQVLHYCARSDLEKLLGPGRQQTTQSFKKLIQEKVDEHEMGLKIVFVGIEAVHPPITVAESFEKVISALQDKQAQILRSQGVSQAILAQARGESNVLKSQADAYAFERSTIAQAVAGRFGQQREAFEKGGEVYIWREYLSVLDQTLPALRKYVISSNNVNSWVIEMDLKEKLQPDLFTGLGIEQEQETAK